MFKTALLQQFGQIGDLRCIKDRISVQALIGIPIAMSIGRRRLRHSCHTKKRAMKAVGHCLFRKDTNLCVQRSDILKLGDPDAWEAAISTDDCRGRAQ